MDFKPDPEKIKRALSEIGLAELADFYLSLKRGDIVRIGENSTAKIWEGPFINNYSDWRMDLEYGAGKLPLIYFIIKENDINGEIDIEELSGCIKDKEESLYHIGAGNIRPLLTDNKVNFVTLSKAYYSDYTNRGEYVIKDNNSLSEILGRESDLPQIDFDNEIVLAVFQGEHPTGGYNIEIKKIMDWGGCLEVIVEDKSPRREDPVTCAFTQPYHIVKIKKTDKRIRFSYQFLPKSHMW